MYTMPVVAAADMLLFVLLVLVAGIARSAPIPAVDLDQCEPTFLFPRFVPGDCCPPKLNAAARAWTPPEQRCAPGSGNPPRVRRPCHLLEAWEQERYNRAYDIMRNELEYDDPRSLYAQNGVHCSYCMLAHPLPWTGGRLQIHFSWLLFSWHRWFLYFHERILARLLDDDTFTLCYWQWDNMVHPDAAHIPWLFIEQPALADPHRSPRHQPPATANLSFAYTPNTVIGPREAAPQVNTDAMVEANLAVMNQAVVGAGTRAGFFGGAYRAPEAGGGGIVANVGFMARTQGSLEASAHNAIHLWVGNEQEADATDMGSFWASANDPLFYAHHGEVDRLWNVWKGLDGAAGGGWRDDISDPDYLASRFTFYDEDGEYVTVSVGDSLDSVSQLCYDYEQVPEADALWINYEGSVCSGPHLDTAHKKQQWLRTIPEHAGLNSTSPLSLTAANSPFTTRIKRPPARPASATTSSDEVAMVEVLVLDDVSLDWNRSASATVFLHLHLPTGSDAGPGLGLLQQRPPVTCAEFLATFTTVPRSAPEGHTASYHWAVDRKLAQLGAADLEDVAVTILAGDQHTMDHPIQIGTIRIQYEPR